MAMFMVMLLIVLVVIDVLAGDGVVLVSEVGGGQSGHHAVFEQLSAFCRWCTGGRPLLVDLMVVMRVMERIYIAKEEFRMSFLNSLVPPPSVVEPVQL